MNNLYQNRENILMSLSWSCKRTVSVKQHHHHHHYHHHHHHHHHNNLPKGTSKQSTCHLFANDCIICRKINTIQNQIDTSKNLDKRKEWADRLGMKFNLSSCQLMRLNQSRQLLKLCFTYYAIKSHSN